MANAATEVTRDSPYFQAFLSKFHREDLVDTNEPWLQEIYKLIAGMLNPSDTVYEIKVTCDQTTIYCTDLKLIAHMGDGKQTMNFCDKFFQTLAADKSIKPTKERLDNCANLNLKLAQWSLSAVILHECTHTTYAMQGEERYVGSPLTVPSESTFMMAQSVSDR